MKEKIITESTKIYPRGRGKVLIISEKTILPKSKKTKQNSFLHTYIKSNPEPIKLKEYINQDEIKRLYLFPEGKQLSREERIDLASSLLISLMHYIPETSGKRFPCILQAEIRKTVKAKWRRYQRWRMKQQ